MNIANGLVKRNVFVSLVGDQTTASTLKGAPTEGLVISWLLVIAPLQNHQHEHQQWRRMDL